MQEPTVENIRISIENLLNNNGINSDALFQSSKRQLKYPGDNLFYTNTRCKLYDLSGFNKQHEIHPDISPSIDEHGNIKFPNLIENIFTNRDHIAEKFSEYSIDNTPIYINYDSFVNRRLQAGINKKESPPPSPRRPVFRSSLSSRLSLLNSKRLSSLRKKIDEDDDDDDDDLDNVSKKDKSKKDEEDEEEDESKKITIKRQPPKLSRWKTSQGNQSK